MSCVPPVGTSNRIPMKKCMRCRTRRQLEHAARNLMHIHLTDVNVAAGLQKINQKNCIRCADFEHKKSGQVLVDVSYIYIYDDDSDQDDVVVITDDEEDDDVVEISDYSSNVNSDEDTEQTISDSVICGLKEHVIPNEDDYGSHEMVVVHGKYFGANNRQTKFNRRPKPGGGSNDDDFRNIRSNRRNVNDKQQKNTSTLYSSSTGQNKGTVQKETDNIQTYHSDKTQQQTSSAVTFKSLDGQNKVPILSAEVILVNTHDISNDGATPQQKTSSSSTFNSSKRQCENPVLSFKRKMNSTQTDHSETSHKTARLEALVNINNAIENSVNDVNEIEQQNISSTVTFKTSKGQNNVPILSAEVILVNTHDISNDGASPQQKTSLSTFNSSKRQYENPVISFKRKMNSTQTDNSETSHKTARLEALLNISNAIEDNVNDVNETEQENTPSTIFKSLEAKNKEPVLSGQMTSDDSHNISNDGATRQEMASSTATFDSSKGQAKYPVSPTAEDIDSISKIHLEIIKAEQHFLTMNEKLADKQDSCKASSVPTETELTEYRLVKSNEEKFLLQPIHRQNESEPSILNTTDSKKVVVNEEDTVLASEYPQNENKKNNCEECTELETDINRIEKFEGNKNQDDFQPALNTLSNTMSQTNLSTRSGEKSEVNSTLRITEAEKLLKVPRSCSSAINVVSKTDENEAYRQKIIEKHIAIAIDVCFKTADQEKDSLKFKTSIKSCKDKNSYREEEVTEVSRRSPTVESVKLYHDTNIESRMRSNSSSSNTTDDPQTNTSNICLIESTDLQTDTERIKKIERSKYEDDFQPVSNTLSNTIQTNLSTRSGKKSEVESTLHTNEAKEVEIREAYRQNIKEKHIVTSNEDFSVLASHKTVDQEEDSMELKTSIKSFKETHSFQKEVTEVSRRSSTAESVNVYHDKNSESEIKSNLSLSNMTNEPQINTSNICFIEYTDLQIDTDRIQKLSSTSQTNSSTRAGEKGEVDSTLHINEAQEVEKREAYKQNIIEKHIVTSNDDLYPLSIESCKEKYSFRKGEVTEVSKRSSTVEPVNVYHNINTKIEVKSNLNLSNTTKEPQINTSNERPTEVEVSAMDEEDLFPSELELSDSSIISCQEKPSFRKEEVTEVTRRSSTAESVNDYSDTKRKSETKSNSSLSNTTKEQQIDTSNKCSIEDEVSAMNEKDLFPSELDLSDSSIISCKEKHSFQKEEVAEVSKRSSTAESENVYHDTNSESKIKSNLSLSNTTKEPQITTSNECPIGNEDEVSAMDEKGLFPPQPDLSDSTVVSCKGKYSVRKEEVTEISKSSTSESINVYHDTNSKSEIKSNSSFSSMTDERQINTRNICLIQSINLQPDMNRIKKNKGGKNEDDFLSVSNTLSNISQTNLSSRSGTPNDDFLASASNRPEKKCMELKTSIKSCKEKYSFRKSEGTEVSSRSSTAESANVYHDTNSESEIKSNSSLGNMTDEPQVNTSKKRSIEDEDVVSATDGKGLFSSELDLSVTSCEEKHSFRKEEETEESRRISTAEFVNVCHDTNNKSEIKSNSSLNNITDEPQINTSYICLIECTDLQTDINRIKKIDGSKNEDHFQPVSKVVSNTSQMNLSTRFEEKIDVEPTFCINEAEEAEKKKTYEQNIIEKHIVSSSNDFLASKGDKPADQEKDSMTLKISIKSCKEKYSLRKEEVTEVGRRSSTSESVNFYHDVNSESEIKSNLSLSNMTDEPPINTSNISLRESTNLQTDINRMENIEGSKNEDDFQPVSNIVSNTSQMNLSARSEEKIDVESTFCINEAEEAEKKKTYEQNIIEKHIVSSSNDFLASEGDKPADQGKDSITLKTPIQSCKEMYSLRKEEVTEVGRRSSTSESVNVYHDTNSESETKSNSTFSNTTKEPQINTSNKRSIGDEVSAMDEKDLISSELHLSDSSIISCKEKHSFQKEEVTEVSRRSSTAESENVYNDTNTECEIKSNLSLSNTAKEPQISTSNEFAIRDEDEVSAMDGKGLFPPQPDLSDSTVVSCKGKYSLRKEEVTEIRRRSLTSESINVYHDRNNKVEIKSNSSFSSMTDKRQINSSNICLIQSINLQTDMNRLKKAKGSKNEDDFLSVSSILSNISQTNLSSRSVTSNDDFLASAKYKPVDEEKDSMVLKTSIKSCTGEVTEVSRRSSTAESVNVYQDTNSESEIKSNSSLNNITDEPQINTNNICLIESIDVQTDINRIKKIVGSKSEDDFQPVSNIASNTSQTNLSTRFGEKIEVESTLHMNEAEVVDKKTAYEQNIIEKHIVSSNNDFLASSSYKPADQEKGITTLRTYIKSSKEEYSFRTETVTEVSRRCSTAESVNVYHDTNSKSEINSNSSLNSMTDEPQINTSNIFLIEPTDLQTDINRIKKIEGSKNEDDFQPVSNIVSNTSQMNLSTRSEENIEVESTICINEAEEVEEKNAYEQNIIEKHIASSNNDFLAPSSYKPADQEKGIMTLRTSIKSSKEVYSFRKETVTKVSRRCSTAESVNVYHDTNSKSEINSNSSLNSMTDEPQINTSNIFLIEPTDLQTDINRIKKIEGSKNEDDFQPVSNIVSNTSQINLSTRSVEKMEVESTFFINGAEEVEENKSYEQNIKEKHIASSNNDFLASEGYKPADQEKTLKTSIKSCKEKYSLRKEEVTQVGRRSSSESVNVCHDINSESEIKSISSLSNSTNALQVITSNECSMGDEDEISAMDENDLIPSELHLSDSPILSCKEVSRRSSTAESVENAHDENSESESNSSLSNTTKVPQIGNERSIGDENQVSSMDEKRLFLSVLDLTDSPVISCKEMYSFRKETVTERDLISSELHLSDSSIISCKEKHSFQKEETTEVSRRSSTAESINVYHDTDSENKIKSNLSLSNTTNERRINTSNESSLGDEDEVSAMDQKSLSPSELELSDSPVLSRTKNKALKKVFCRKARFDPINRPDTSKSNKCERNGTLFAEVVIDKHQEAGGCFTKKSEDVEENDTDVINEGNRSELQYIMEHFKKRLIHQCEGGTTAVDTNGKEARSSEKKEMKIARKRPNCRSKFRHRDLEIYKLGSNTVSTSLCKTKEPYSVCKEKKLQEASENGNETEKLNRSSAIKGRHSLPAIVNPIPERRKSRSMPTKILEDGNNNSLENICNPLENSSQLSENPGDPTEKPENAVESCSNTSPTKAAEENGTAPAVEKIQEDIFPPIAQENPINLCVKKTKSENQVVKERSRTVNVPVRNKCPSPVQRNVPTKPSQKIVPMSTHLDTSVLANFPANQMHGIRNQHTQGGDEFQEEILRSVVSLLRDRFFYPFNADSLFILNTWYKYLNQYLNLNQSGASFSVLVSVLRETEDFVMTNLYFLGCGQNVLPISRLFVQEVLMAELNTHKDHLNQLLNTEDRTGDWFNRLYDALKCCIQASDSSRNGLPAISISNDEHPFITKLPVILELPRIMPKPTIQVRQEEHAVHMSQKAKQRSKRAEPNYGNVTSSNASGQRDINIPPTCFQPNATVVPQFNQRIYVPSNYETPNTKNHPNGGPQQVQQKIPLMDPSVFSSNQSESIAEKVQMHMAMMNQMSRFRFPVQRGMQIPTMGDASLPVNRKNSGVQVRPEMRYFPGNSVPVSQQARQNLRVPLIDHPSHMPEMHVPVNFKPMQPKRRRDSVSQDVNRSAINQSVEHLNPVPHQAADNRRIYAKQVNQNMSVPVSSTSQQSMAGLASIQQSNLSSHVPVNISLKQPRINEALYTRDPRRMSSSMQGTHASKPGSMVPHQMVQSEQIQEARGSERVLQTKSELAPVYHLPETSHGMRVSVISSTEQSRQRSERSNPDLLVPVLHIPEASQDVRVPVHSWTDDLNKMNSCMRVPVIHGVNQEKPLPMNNEIQHPRHRVPQEAMPFPLTTRISPNSQIQHHDNAGGVRRNTRLPGEDSTATSNSFAGRSNAGLSNKPCTVTSATITEPNRSSASQRTVVAQNAEKYHKDYGPIRLPSTSFNSENNSLGSTHLLGTKVSTTMGNVTKTTVPTMTPINTPGTSAPYKACAINSNTLQTDSDNTSEFEGDKGSDGSSTISAPMITQDIEEVIQTNVIVDPVKSVHRDILQNTIPHIITVNHPSTQLNKDWQLTASEKNHSNRQMVHTEDRFRSKKVAKTSNAVEGEVKENAIEPNDSMDWNSSENELRLIKDVLKHQFTDTYPEIVRRVLLAKEEQVKMKHCSLESDLTEAGRQKTLSVHSDSTSSMSPKRKSEDESEATTKKIKSKSCGNENFKSEPVLSTSHAQTPKPFLPIIEDISSDDDTHSTSGTIKDQKPDHQFRLAKPNENSLAVLNQTFDHEGKIVSYPKIRQQLLMPNLLPSQLNCGQPLPAVPSSLPMTPESPNVPLPEVWQTWLDEERLRGNSFFTPFSGRRQSIETISSAGSDYSPRLSTEDVEIKIDSKWYRVKKHIYERIPKGKLYYIQHKNIFVRYFDGNQMEQFYRSIGLKNPTGLDSDLLSPKKARVEHDAETFLIPSDPSQVNEVIEVDKQVTFSTADQLREPEMYVEEIENVRRYVPKDFFGFYQFVTGYQIVRHNCPISFHMFLVLHNTNRIKKLLYDYVNALMQGQCIH